MAKNPTVTKIDFMARRKVAVILSALVLSISVVSLFVQQLNLGLDFTGGLAIELAYEEDADLPSIRSTLESSEFSDAIVQNYGDEKTVLIKILDVKSDRQQGIGEAVSSLLKENSEAVFVVKRTDIIGAVVGNELRDKSGMAFLVAMGIMLLYVMARFSFKFALGAITALFHDVLLTLGFFSVFQIQFDLSVLAAILAVVGYSLNDTIVVSVRVRENFTAARREQPIEIINKSLNETLGRTIITSLTTLFVLFSLFLFGGEILRGFSIALIVGVVVGTYSSIYIASNVLLSMGIDKKDFIEIKPETAEEFPVN